MSTDKERKGIEVHHPFLLEYGVGIRLLIFDLDGTLIDSSVDISHALNYTIRPYALAEVTVEETIALIGEGVARLIGKLIEQRAPVSTCRPCSRGSPHITRPTSPITPLRILVRKRCSRPSTDGERR